MGSSRMEAWRLCILSPGTGTGSQNHPQSCLVLVIYVRKMADQGEPGVGVPMARGGL